MLLFAAIKTTVSAYKAFRKEVEDGKLHGNPCFERTVANCDNAREVVRDLVLTDPDPTAPTWDWSGGVIRARGEAESEQPTQRLLTLADGGTRSEDPEWAAEGAAAEGAAAEGAAAEGAAAAPSPPLTSAAADRAAATARTIATVAPHLAPPLAHPDTLSAGGRLAYAGGGPAAPMSATEHRFPGEPLPGTTATPPPASPLTHASVGEPSFRRLSNASVAEVHTVAAGGRSTDLSPIPPGLVPQPIDGGRVIVLVLTWVLFAAQYRLSDVDIPRKCDELGSCNYRYLPYEGLRVTLYLLLLLIIILSFLLTRQSQRERDEFGVAVLPGDIVWTLEKTITTQAMAVFVGICAGLLGLGGGELMAPLLVHLGMLPETVSASNAFMIFFTSAADLEHYSDKGVLQLYADTVTRPGYVVLAIVIGFFGALCGRIAAVRFVAKFAHPSVLIFLLAVTLTLSAALLVGRLMQRDAQNVDLRMHDLMCSWGEGSHQSSRHALDTLH